MKLPPLLNMEPAAGLLPSFWPTGTAGGLPGVLLVLIFYFVSPLLFTCMFLHLPHKSQVQHLISQLISFTGWGTASRHGQELRKWCLLGVQDKNAVEVE